MFGQVWVLNPNLLYKQNPFGQSSVINIWDVNITIGYVAIHCDIGREVQTYERLVSTPHVKEASIVLGVYDIMCKIEAGTTKELETTVMQIRKIPHVRTTMTLLVL